MNEYGPSSGIARNASESAHPGLWRQLVGMWCPSAGRQGGRLIDYARNNPVTLTNGPSWVSGRKGPALDMDGVDDYLVSGPSLPDLSAGFTFSVWLRPGFTAPGSTERAILLIGSGGARIYILWVPSLGWYVDVSSAGAFYTTTRPIFISGQWVHLAVTSNSASTTGKISLNGQSVGVTYSSTANLPNTSVLTAGIGRLAGSSSTWIGAMDDIRLYSRALSPREIMASYMGASPLVRRRDDAIARALASFRAFWARRPRNIGTGTLSQ